MRPEDGIVVARTFDLVMWGVRIPARQADMIRAQLMAETMSTAQQVAAAARATS